MKKRKYTDAQIMWLEANSYSRVWKNRAEFRDAFNKTFGTDISEYKFNNLVLYYGIKICTRQTESVFTDEQKQWLIDNAQSGVFKNCKHLTDTYNAVFKECRKYGNVQSYLANWGVSLNTKYTSESGYTDEMDMWLKDNYLKYKTVDEAVVGFNEEFGCFKTAAAIAHHCSRVLGIKRKETRFKNGTKSVNAKELHCVSDRSDCKWIKVNDSNDKSAWIPLHKYVWEQEYGKIPGGCCVVFLNNDRSDVSLDNLALIDRRGTAVMCKLGWWNIDNAAIKRTAIQWCNLHFVAKDNGVYG